jgi:hypothetical protein
MMFESLKNLFRKESKMAETTQQPSFDPVAFAKELGQSIDKAVRDGIAQAIKPLAESQKAMADSLTAQAAEKTAAAKKAGAEAEKAAGSEAGGAKPLTAEDVAKLLESRLDARDAAAKGTGARSAYLADKLKDVPASYQVKLGNDPAKWAAEEQAARDELKADLAKMGVKLKDVGGDQPGGVTTSSTTANTPAALKAIGLSDGEAQLAASMKLPG